MRVSRRGRPETLRAYFQQRMGRMQPAAASTSPRRALPCRPLRAAAPGAGHAPPVRGAFSQPFQLHPQSRRISPPQVQATHRLCVARDLSEHDIAARIMRRENYLVGMLNKVRAGPGQLGCGWALPGCTRREHGPIGTLGKVPRSGLVLPVVAAALLPWRYQPAGGRRAPAGSSTRASYLRAHPPPRLMRRRTPRRACWPSTCRCRACAATFC